MRFVKNNTSVSLAGTICSRFDTNNWISYNPFDIELKYTYYVEKLSDNAGYLYCYRKNPISDFSFKLYYEGHIPSGGLILSEEVTNFSDKIILDLGTGAGIISIFAGLKKARKIVAVDINPKWTEICRYNSRLNKLKNTIKIFKGDLFDCVKGYKFDKILTNPPQMPTPRNNYDIQDFGGLLGWDFLDRLISAASNHLTNHGEIWIVMLDFLGINCRYGGYPSLFERLEDNGFKPEIVISANRVVRRGGATEKMIPYILSIYPNYEFFDNLGNYYKDSNIIKNKLKQGIRMYYGVKVVRGILK